jgi:hypothetical protein
MMPSKSSRGATLDHLIMHPWIISPNNMKLPQGRRNTPSSQKGNIMLSQKSSPWSTPSLFSLLLCVSTFLALSVAAFRSSACWGSCLKSLHSQYFLGARHVEWTCSNSWFVFDFKVALSSGWSLNGSVPHTNYMPNTIQIAPRTSYPMELLYSLLNSLNTL